MIWLRLWSCQGSLVAVGTHKGYVQIWDAAGGRKLTSLEGHSARVGQSSPAGYYLLLANKENLQTERNLIITYSVFCVTKHVLLSYQEIAHGIFDSRSEIWAFVPKVPWRGMESSCRRGVGTEWSSSGTSEPPLPPRGGCKVTDKKCAVSSGLLTTSTWRLEATITRWDNINFFLGTFEWMTPETNKSPSHPLSVSCSGPAAGVEQLQPSPHAAVQRSPGSSEGHRLVATPARAAGVRWRHRRPLPALLEHADGSGAAEHRHRLAGVQPGLVQTC